MSPELIDIAKLRGEERDVDIISAVDDLRNIVGRPLSGKIGVLILLIDSTTSYRCCYAVRSEGYTRNDRNAG